VKSLSGPRIYFRSLVASRASGYPPVPERDAFARFLAAARTLSSGNVACSQSVAKIEIDALARHQAIAEGGDIRKRDDEGATRPRHARPFPTARAPEVCSTRHDVITEGMPLVFGRQIGETP
jgi:hypothetical protein